MGSEMQNTGMSAVDAQFNNVRILKPFSGFEQRYQGLATNIPIALPAERDPRAAAGRPGFDPNLMSGLPVSLGQRLLIWFPVAAADDFVQRYTYRIVFRYRNLADFRQPGGVRAPRMPFHFPLQEGVADTSTAPPSERTIIPASYWTVGFEQAQVGTQNGELEVVPEGITIGFDANNFIAPLLPDGTSGVVQQGVFDPNVQATESPMPVWLPFWLDAGGDDMLILVNREDQQNPSNTWDFTAQNADLGFSNVYGTNNGAKPPEPNVGIYVVGGTNP